MVIPPPEESAFWFTYQNVVYISHVSRTRCMSSTSTSPCLLFCNSARSCLLYVWNKGGGGFCMFVWFSFGSVHLSWRLSCPCGWFRHCFATQEGVLWTIDFWTYWPGMYSKQGKTSDCYQRSGEGNRLWSGSCRDIYVLYEEPVFGKLCAPTILLYYFLLFGWFSSEAYSSSMRCLSPLIQWVVSWFIWWHYVSCINYMA